MYVPQKEIGQPWIGANCPCSKQENRMVADEIGLYAWSQRNGHVPSRELFFLKLIY